MSTIKVGENESIDAKSITKSLPYGKRRSRKRHAKEAIRINHKSLLLKNNGLFACAKNAEREEIMQKIREKNFKSIAKEAKSRLKSGFWENCKDEFRTDVARAKNAGISESRAGRYFAGKITCTVKGGDDDAFYEKVKAMLLAEGEVSDAIGRLTDRAYYDTLTYEEKQRYTLTLSERYLKALERFRRESEYEGRRRG